MVVTPARQPALLAVKVFEYIGTKKNKEGEKGGDVFLSTNTDSLNPIGPVLVYNWANDNGSLGWTGSVILKIIFVLIIGF